jgi:hypothetical protein
MGQVGGNGSVVWQNQHRYKRGKFKCKARGKLKHDELGLGDELDVWGHDDIPPEDIGTDSAPGLESGLEGFQRSGYFLVRLRFDGAEADAISKWYETIGRNLPPVIRLVRVGGTIILAINVEALDRIEPEDGVSWPNLPFEIRYDW